MYYTSEIKQVKEISSGTYLKIFIPDAHLKDKILRHKQNNKAYADIRLDDKRTITNLQRKKYYATLRDISDYTGYLEEEMHSYFKMLYRELHEDIHISMSSCTISQAKNMITILIAFIMTNDIPLSDLAINRVEEIDKYLYGSMINLRCCICGKNAEIRTKADDEDIYAIALCEIHYIATENITKKEYLDKHKVYPIKLDEYAVMKLGL